MSHPTTEANAPIRTPRLRTPPGPRGGLLGSALNIRRDPLGFFLDANRRYGDVVKYRFVIWPGYFVNHPDYVKRILQDNHRNYSKDVFDYNLLRRLLGVGLLTSEGDTWLRQRRLAQPAFHRRRIAELGTLMTGATVTMLEQWQPLAERAQPLDVAVEMMRLTLHVVSSALFGTDVGDDADTVGRAFATANRHLSDFLYVPFPPLSVPTRRSRQLKAATGQLDEVVHRIIDWRRRSMEDRGDLLFMLMQARDEETGQGMDDRQLRDEVMTLLLAGHETTANLLAWAWYLLDNHQEVECRLHAELDNVLGGRLPAVEDLPTLPYTRIVLEEALRLYPPAWAISRKAEADDELGGYHIPANAVMLMSPFAMHRHPDFWENPDAFDPERFAPERASSRPRYA